MEPLADRIARLEAENEQDKAVIAEANIRIARRLTEMQLLRQGADESPLEQMATLKEAVLAALRAQQGPMAPADIVGVLQQHGRDVHVPSVRGTLNTLKKEGLVTRAGSKQWLVLA